MSITISGSAIEVAASVAETFDVIFATIDGWRDGLEAQLSAGAPLTAGFIDPGFSGHVTLELSNVATLPIKLWPGMKIGQLCFFRLSSPAENPYGSGPYGNRYQGQRGPTASRSFQNFHRSDVAVTDAGSPGA